MGQERDESLTGDIPHLHVREVVKKDLLAVNEASDGDTFELIYDNDISISVIT